MSVVHGCQIGLYIARQGPRCISNLPVS